MRRKKHGAKIVAEVVDRVPRTIIWHVIECECGWSSALCSSSASALSAYDAHKPVRRKKAA